MLLRLAIAASLLALPARADIISECEADGAWEAKRQACTAAIDSGDWSGRDLAWAYNNRGVAQNLLGRYAAAEVDYTQAIELLPEFGEAYNGRANARCRLGEYEASVADRLQALELGAFTAESAQVILKDQGFYGGAIDGQFGSGSKAGLLAWTKAGCPGVD